MKRAWILIVLASLSVVPGWGAERAEFRFSAGDVLDVTVTPQHSFDRTVTVQPDGKISYPRVGQLQAAGLTVAELAEKLQGGLNRELVDPRVTVSLKEASKPVAARVSLLGAVRTPGVIDIKEGTTLAEALAQAGGPAPTADLRRVTITRADRSVITVDLAQTEQTGRLERDAVLQAGDFIVVPQGAPPTVIVLGEVAKPGSVEIQGAARLLDAISLAGGPTPKADLRRVTIAHAGEAARERGSEGARGQGGHTPEAGPGARERTRTLDLQTLFTGGGAADTSLNVLVQPGDTILIGETDQHVYVLGRVAKPDVYPIKPNDRVLDVLVRAGGATADADLAKAVLVRQDGTGQPVASALDLKKIMATGSRAENDLLRAGDVLFIPDKKTHHSAADTANLIWPLTGLINLFHR